MTLQSISLTLVFCATVSNAFPFSGSTAVLDNLQTFKVDGWNYIAGWNAKDVTTKPGLFITGVSMDNTKTEIVINQPGVYFISYNLRLDTSSNTKLTAGVVIDKDLNLGLNLKSHEENYGTKIDISAAGFLRLTEFNNVSIAVHATNYATARLQSGSSFTVALITAAGAVPSFSFSLPASRVIHENKLIGLDGWSESRKGEFHVSIGFSPRRQYVQMICDGIYLISANFIVKGTTASSVFVMQIRVNDRTVKEIRKEISATTTTTINFQQIMHLYNTSTVSIKVYSVYSATEVLKHSTWSASLINKISKHTYGFNSYLRNNISISNTDTAISGWPADFNQATEFKSPTLFAQLVNNKQDFNPPGRGIYMITTNVIFTCESVKSKGATVSLYSKGYKFALVTKAVSTGNCNASNVTSVSLSTVADILRTESFSVSVTINSGSVLVMPGSSFAVCEFPLYYPGMLGRLTKPATYSAKGWLSLKGWKTDEVRGGYDFFGGVNSTSGNYRIPFDGLYLLSTSIIVMDMNEAQALITVGQRLNIENGMFTKVGNPSNVMTLNIAGIMELKRNDEVSAMVNSPSDTDWSVKENTGLSIAYIGRNSHAFRAYVPAVVEVKTSGWTAVQTWQSLLHYGGTFTPSTGKFLVPVSGVYHTTATIILQNADSTLRGVEYMIAIKVNNVVATGLLAQKSAPKSPPVKRRHYPLFLSGSFKANKTDIVTLEVFTKNDGSYNILEFSGWSLFLVSEDGSQDQVGFSASKDSLQNFFSTAANSWEGFSKFAQFSTAIGAFYTPSKIGFDGGITATIKSTGFYTISANVKIQHETSNAVFKLALFVQDELQQNGIYYENLRESSSFTMHLTGTAFLMAGETITLKMTGTAKFDGLVIFKESGFSIVKLPVAEFFPGASLISRKQYNIPIATNMPVNMWSADESAASFSFTSGKRYNKTNGIFRVRDAGYYLVSMNLVIQSNATNSTNVSIAMVHGSGRDRFSLQLGNGTLSAVSSTILKFQEVGSTIQIATNASTTLDQQLTSVNNSTIYEPSDIFIQEGSSFSVVQFPLGSSVTTSEAVYMSDRSYSTPVTTELSHWSVQFQVGTSEAKFRATKEGIYFISMNIKLVHFIGCATFYFKSNKGDMATSTVTCTEHCQEYITLNNFVRLWNGDGISVYMTLEQNSHLTIATGSRRTVTYIRPYEKAIGLSVRVNNVTSVQGQRDSWRALYRYSLGNNTHGTFDARGNFSAFEGMIIPATGAYQVVVNLLLLYSSSKQRIGTVEVVVSKDGIVSQASALYTKRSFATGFNFTLHIMSSVIITKWTKLHLMIKSDTDLLIQKGSTVSLVFLDSIVHEVCPDSGPVMGDNLRPAFIATAIVGVKREWTCLAFGNSKPHYSWYKDDKRINGNNKLQLNGTLADTGKYHCVADVNGITTESNNINIQIYDVDECYYKNHTCDGNATCSNTKGSFSCTCKLGFIGNGYVCQDQDECTLGTHNCAKSSECLNTPGSFTCQCSEGYFGDGKNFCNDKNECILSLHKCDHRATCSNLNGTYNCTCNAGWAGTGWNCSDADECVLGTHNCDKNANCSNTNGSYDCMCNKGFLGDGISGNCTDVNECLFLPTATPYPTINGTLLHPLYCSKYGECVNSPGFYGCRCKSGFTGNGTHCYDINECELGTKAVNCDSQTADCVNTPGSYQCKCRAGYTGDGIQCKDIDECATKTSTCDKLANCTNQYGAFKCSCPKGYFGDGTTCALASQIGKSTDPCDADKTSLKCICQNSKTRDENILCNGLFVAIIILSVVAIVVVMFVVKYIKSRKNIKIGPVRTARDKYIEMEDESEV